ncbi:hypothetical protein ILUMI_11382 [Ignelater luminosus]|uniref:DDE Tnp4 domain-containing protein n=1 Tax=Ignelater luminosus TaxID=2038154 RepID=A0A8K0GAJ9_IGNLU|nr:hypothetical protein ILUMI_11382 [Ignelater luminosus]
MRDNALNIPNNRTISMDGDPLPFAFVGDEAFVLSTHMQKPYGGKNLTRQEKVYNYRLSRARHMQNAKTIVKACCTLHNFVRERDGIDFDNTLNVVRLDEAEAEPENGFQVKVSCCGKIK